MSQRGTRKNYKNGKNGNKNGYANSNSCGCSQTNGFTSQCNQYKELANQKCQQAECAMNKANKYAQEAQAAENRAEA